ncbi:MKL2 protein, partial [Neodrepanis coruscans]|nr:MKL2 protein [Neodrepanis coruscans]
SLLSVLQLRLQQRRTREQLVDQGIMPPLKSPAAFHEQIKSLERARTENFLKHKIRSRPDRSELVRMHILEETVAEPSLQATQMKLKRARLADDLNEKIAQRPGPMELVEKNILPVDSSVKEAIIGKWECHSFHVGQENYPQALDDFSFDEDSSDALSPDQPASQESQGSAASPGEPKPSDSPSPITPNAATATQYPPLTSPVPEFLKTPSTIDQHVTRSTAAATLSTNTISAAKPGPTLVKQSHPKNPNDKHRSKKCKEPKPRVKKLKYHQYIPPDQKGEKNEPQMDSNYARLLQQQQLFLQLQILSQQQQHYNYQTILPAPLKYVKHCFTPPSTGSSPRQSSTVPSRKPGPLPSSLDDLKVAELKMELKLRGLPVSGTKTDLIERLKTYQDLNNNGVASSTSVTVTTSAGPTGNTGEVTVAFPVAALNKPVANTISSFPPEKTPTAPGSKAVNAENMGSPLPISPSPSEQSSLSTDDTSMADTFTEMMTMVSPSQFLSTSPVRANMSDDNQSRSSGSISAIELDVAEKDRKLQEKEKQIEELKRKLEQEQKLVEVLKMQLEVEKRGQQQQAQSGNSAALEQKQFSAAVKDETAPADCSSTSQAVPVASHSLGQSVYTSGQNPVAKKAVVIKQEIPVAKAEPQNAISQFYVNPQRQPQTAVVAQPQALLTTQGTAQLLLPLSIQGPNSATAVQLPVGNIKLQVRAPSQAGIQTPAQIPAAISSPGLGQAAPQPHQPQSQAPPIPQHTLGHTQPLRKVFPPTTSNAVFSYQTAPVTTPSQSFTNKTSNSNIHTGGNQVPPVQNGPAAPNKPGSPSQAQPYIVQQPLFNSTVSKAKDPPRYEEAIKQTRSIQTPHREISSAHSQQMDDLFDILIKSGEISLPIKEEPSPISKMRPVTANITTMPVNTVISRPPPQIQMAPPPVSLEPTTSLSISLENQLEALLDGTLPSGNEIPPLTSSTEDRESFSLIEELQNDLLNHSSILDHSHSPMETSDPQFTTNNCLSLDLPDTNLDNMEWLDITMPSSSSGLTPLSSAAPSVFSTDFLDPQDLQLHWD